MDRNDILRDEACSFSRLLYEPFIKFDSNAKVEIIHCSQESVKVISDDELFSV